MINKQPYTLTWWKDMWTEAVSRHDDAVFEHNDKKAIRYGLLADWIDDRIRDMELKLYVWTEFCPDYTNGLAFAIASSQKEAMDKIKDNHSYIHRWGNLTIHELNEEISYSVMGGS